MKKTIISIIIIIALSIIAALVFDWGRRETILPETDTDFTATNTSPQDLSAASSMPITVNNIVDGQNVTSPIKITGKASGNWFFEGTFPIELVDMDENVICSTTAKAEGDWATTSLVNFSADLEYTKATSTDKALIVLSNDNPSGDPKFAKSIFISVTLK